MFLFYFILTLLQVMYATSENTFLNSLKTSGLGYDLGTPDLWYEATKGGGGSFGDRERENRGIVCHNKYGTIKDLPCSKAASAE